jgi:Amt family ammonium transporter
LVAAYVLGPRRGYGQDNLAPHDLSLAVIGTGLLWVGWFGFNGGSALGATPRAAFAIVATHLAACTGVLAWMALEWLDRGKPSVLGLISGAVAGLGTVTPASGYILPWHGAVIGIVAGAVCYWACTKLKTRFRYDDSLDVFGVHGIGGLIGTVMVGIFAVKAVGGVPGALEGNGQQVLTQLYGIVVTLAWSGGMTFVILKGIGLFLPLRVRDEDERMGLDLSLHGEQLQ